MKSNDDTDEELYKRCEDAAKDVEFLETEDEKDLYRSSLFLAAMWAKSVTKKRPNAVRTMVRKYKIK